MVPALERGLSVSRSFNFKRILQSPSRQRSHIPVMDDVDLCDLSSLESQSQTSEALGGSPVSQSDGGRGARIGNSQERPQSDMSGGGKGVSSALALSNAITNLAASIYGEQTKLQPMPPDRRARWKKEIDWLLSVTDHIVEFVPSQQMTKDGNLTEIMVTRQRGDLLMNIPAPRKLDAMLIDTLDNFRGHNEFYYVSRDSEEGKNTQNGRRNEKWWLPPVKVPPNGLSEECFFPKRIQSHRSKKPPWPSMLKFSPKWPSQIATSNPSHIGKRTWTVG